jgi:hypothetical protein
MKKTLLLMSLLAAFAGRAQLVNKALIVPEFSNGKIKTYLPSSATTIAANTSYTIDFATLTNGLNTAASPNCTAMFGNDLFVSITAANQRIYKFPGYGTNPTIAIANVSQITNLSSDYVGLAFDTTGNLYTSEGSSGNTTIFKYTVASNYATRVNLGNGGVTSYFANIAFDTAGNLWATDYKNNRIIAIPVASLNTANATFRYCNTNSTAWTIGGTNGNLTGNLNIKTIRLAFSQPEGIAFDSTNMLWIANNNDGSSGANTNDAPTLVRISTTMQTNILNGTVTQAVPNDTNSINGFRVWNLPSSTSGRGQLGGMQIDKSVDRIYVNEQVNGSGLWFDIDTLSNIVDNFNTFKINITSTNPGNGGIYLAPSTQMQILGNEYFVSNANLQLFPNPSHGSFNITTNEGIKNVKAFDVLGKEVNVNASANNQFFIEKKGIYFLTIEIENGKILNTKIIIN